MEKMPTMKVIRKLDAEGKLKGPQKLFTRKTKPEEELYDITADPHEINDLAKSPKHRKILKRMRGTLDKWMKDTNDLGLIPEKELNKRRLVMARGQEWSPTAPPLISMTGIKPNGQAVIKVNCPTKGSSIGYTTQKGRGRHIRWRLYTHEITVKKNELVRFKASRLGYTDSPEVQVIYKDIPGTGKKLEVAIPGKQEAK